MAGMRDDSKQTFAIHKIISISMRDRMTMLFTTNLEIWP